MFGNWLFNREIRRWKRAADAAVSTTHIRRARGGVALEVAAHFAGLHGDAAWNVPGLDQRAESLVSDAWVRAVLAARHLDILRESVAHADHEDLVPIARESAWTEHYLLPILLKPLHSRLQRPACDAAEGWTDRLLELLVREHAPLLEAALAA